VFFAQEFQAVPPSSRWWAWRWSDSGCRCSGSRGKCQSTFWIA